MMYVLLYVIKANYYMSIQITLSANAGIALCVDNTCLWIDALHQSYVPGFSTLSPAQIKQLLTGGAFPSPDALIFTHCHPDHYDRELVLSAQQRWPESSLILPQQEFASQELLRGDSYTTQIGNLTIQFVRLPHAKEQYVDVPHYGIEIICSMGRILIPGDCDVASASLYKEVRDRRYRVACLNFPWITLKKGQRFIEENIDAEQYVIYHLPFIEDDTEHFRSATNRVLDSWHFNRNVSILSNFLQTISIM